MRQRKRKTRSMTERVIDGVDVVGSRLSCSLHAMNEVTGSVGQDVGRFLHTGGQRYPETRAKVKI